MIEIDDGVFGLMSNGWSSNESFVMTGTFEPARAVEALRRVGERYMTVDEEGGEGVSVGDSLYTPNWVDEPIALARGIVFGIDCKSQIEPPMRATFLRILREELSAHGIVDARVEPVPDPTEPPQPGSAMAHLVALYGDVIEP